VSQLRAVAVRRITGVFFAVGSITLAGLISTSALGESNVSSKRYTSARYGYSLAYPSNWQVVKATTSKLSEAFPTEPLAAVDKFLSCGDNCAKGIAVVVYARKLPTRKTVRAFASSEAAALRSAYGCAPKSKVSGKLAGEPEIVLTYAFCLGNYLVEHAVVHHSHGFDVYLLAPTGHEARNRSTFAAILKTMRFTR
jgi:hypothetical protein